MKQVKPTDYQLLFQMCPADLTLAGAMAGVGKSYGVLLMALARALQNNKFRIGVFRDNFTLLDLPGGLIEDSNGIYQDFDCSYNKSKHRWTFHETGSTITFGYINYLNFRNYSGSQYDLIILDELQNFTIKEVLFIFSRLRGSLENAKDRAIFATLNPEPQHFSREWVDYYIAPDGTPDKSKLHKMIFFVNIENELVFADNKEDLLSKFSIELEDIMSFAFIPADGLQDNPKIGADYKRFLNSLPLSEKKKLLFGNWNETDADNILFPDVKVNNLLTNRPEALISKALSVDVARLGKDKAIVAVLIDNVVKELRIFSRSKFSCEAGFEESGMFYLKDEINNLAAVYNIPNSRIVIDQDGLGGGLIDLFPNCVPFYNNGTPLLLKDVKEMYQNLKTQLYYKLSEVIENNNLKIDFSNVYLDNVRITELKKGKSYLTVLNYLKRELKAIRREPKKNEKYRINSKDDQKALNLGQSPDISDTLMMLMYFMFIPPKSTPKVHSLKRFSDKRSRFKK